MEKADQQYKIYVSEHQQLQVKYEQEIKRLLGVSRHVQPIF